MSVTTPKIVGIYIGWQSTDLSEVMGLSVANTSLLKAFLQYSTIDRWHIFLPAPIYDDLDQKCQELFEHAKTHNCLDKIDFYRDYAVLDCINTVPYWAFHCGDPFLSPWLNLRAGVSPVLFPITGITHSLDVLNKHTWEQQIAMAPHTVADAVVCTCQAGKQVVQRIVSSLLPQGSVFEQNLTLIPLAVEDPLAQLPSSTTREQAKLHAGLCPDRLAVLVAGRISLMRKADLHPLLVAIKLIKDQWPQGQPIPIFLITGAVDLKNPYLASLGQHACDLGLEDWVLFRMNFKHQDRAWLLKAADVFVSMPDSLQETFGLAPAEAMMAGCPVVIADWAGYREHITDGQHGFLVPTYWGQTDPRLDFLSFLVSPDIPLRISQSIAIDIHQLAKRLQTLLSDAPVRTHMGKQAQERAQKTYSGPVVVAQYEQLWQRLNQQATQVAWAGPTLNPNRLYHNVIFKHYPTQFLDFDTYIKVSDYGHNAQIQNLFKYYAHTLYWFTPESLSAVLDALGPTSKTIQQLAAQLDTNPSELMQRALWLLKHGIVECIGSNKSINF